MRASEARPLSAGDAAPPPALDAVRSLLHRGVRPGKVPEALVRRPARLALFVLGPSILAGLLWLVLPRWYQSGATLTVEAGTLSPTGGAVLGLASQLGLAGAAAATSPQFYADLLTSRVLLEHVLGSPLPFSDASGLEPLEVFWNHGKPVDARAHARAVRLLQRHFAASANPRTGVITLTVDGPTRRAAKLMADTALAALNNLVVSIRKRHASEERAFLEARWTELRDSLASREGNLRAFYERNRQISSPQLQFEELRLRREVDRIQGIFVQVGSQLEQARIQEVRDVPAISVIDSPIEPITKVSPKLAVMLVTAALLGFLCAMVVALLEIASSDLIRGQ